MSPILVWEGSGDVPNFCPQGCGGITDDPYGGPCKACWDAVDADPDIDSDDAERRNSEYERYAYGDPGIQL